MTPFDTFFSITKIHSVLDMSWSAGKRKALGNSRPYHAISIRLRGKALITHGDETFEINAGDVLYLPRLYEYDINSLENERIICFHFDIDENVAAHACQSCGDSLAVGIYKPIDSSICTELFARLLKTWDEKKPGYEYAAMSLANSIIENVISEQQQKTYSSISNMLGAALLYANTHFTSPDFTVPELAQNVGVSEVYLRRLFRSELGTSPHEYIAKLRVNHAEAILRSGYYTVEEAAYRSGYRSVKNFSVFFRKQTGVAPSTLLRTGKSR